MKRSGNQKIKDFITFPFRALFLLEYDKWGFSSLASERYDYVSREVLGHCLDVGCGRHNRFVKSYLNGKGKGIDVFPYEGLTKENLIEDITHFPFSDSSFDSVTFIANINHVPRDKRVQELKEAYRCLRPAGNIVVTMGNCLAEILIHKLAFFYSKIFKDKPTMDFERGISKDEDLYLKDEEITRLIAASGFKKITKKYFLTQWNLNHMFIGWKV